MRSRPSAEAESRRSDHSTEELRRLEMALGAWGETVRLVVRREHREMVLQQPVCEGSGKNPVCVWRVFESLICPHLLQAFKENAIP